MSSPVNNLLISLNYRKRNKTNPINHLDITDKIYPHIVI